MIYYSDHEQPPPMALWLMGQPVHLLTTHKRLINDLLTAYRLLTHYLLTTDGAMASGTTDGATHLHLPLLLPYAYP